MSKSPRGPSGLVSNNTGQWVVRDLLGLHGKEDWRQRLDEITAKYHLWRHWLETDSPDTTGRGGWYIYDYDQVKSLLDLWDAKRREGGNHER